MSSETSGTEEREVRVLEQLLTKLQEHRSLIYTPYPRQLEFHTMGLHKRKRCLMAGNQVGKTWCAGNEVSFHATGLYPDWWSGRRFATPIRCWVGGPNAEHVRDNAQRVLFGQLPDEIGTGAIPKDKIVGVEMLRGRAQAIDHALVRHVSGGQSYIKFKSYDQQTDAWSGETLHFVWFDEEPPEDKWSEGLTRTNTGDSGRMGMIFLTITPLLGMSRVVRRFHPHPKEPDAGLIRMGIADALHYSKEDQAAIAATYPAHERRARVEGWPQLGEGAVFSVDWDLIFQDDFSDLTRLPQSWLRLGGLDFGFTHPFAAVEMAWDRDDDVLYCLRDFRQSATTVAVIGSALRRWGEKWLPWAWPKDGWSHDLRSGGRTKDLLVEEGLNLMPTHAAFEDGSNGLEDGLLEMSSRFANRKLRISSRCMDLRAELETYHRENGRVVKEEDDVISALRYAMMMRRFGALPGAAGRVTVVTGGLTYEPLRRSVPVRNLMALQGGRR